MIDGFGFGENVVMWFVCLVACVVVVVIVIVIVDDGLGKSQDRD